ncbi:SdpI family protein [Halobacteriales archaeon Cl-PHB]
MKLERRDLVGGGIVLVTVVVSALVYPDLPEEMAIHFGSSGEPNNFVARPLAVVSMPALSVALLALFDVLPRVDPLGENFAEFEAYYDLVVVLTVGVLAYVQILILGWNLGYDVPVTQAIVPLLAVVYYVVGVVVENAEQNWFVGIRTPWTLSSEEVWDRTHRRSGILFKLAGVVSLSALVYPQHFELLVIGPIAVAALLPTVYSYLVYRRVEKS